MPHLRDPSAIALLDAWDRPRAAKHHLPAHHGPKALPHRPASSGAMAGATGAATEPANGPTQQNGQAKPKSLAAKKREKQKAKKAEKKAERCELGGGEAGAGHRATAGTAAAATATSFCRCLSSACACSCLLLCAGRRSQQHAPAASSSSKTTSPQSQRCACLLLLHLGGRPRQREASAGRARCGNCMHGALCSSASWICCCKNVQGVQSSLAAAERRPRGLTYMCIACAPCLARRPDRAHLRMCPSLLLCPPPGWRGGGGD